MVNLFYLLIVCSMKFKFTFLLFSYAVSLAFGQFEIDHFNLMKNNVKKLSFSKNDFFEYNYGKGVIIERDRESVFGCEIVRKYHFSEINRLDSVEYSSSYPDTVYSSTEYYNYAADGKLLKVQIGSDLKNEIVRIDSFAYDVKGRNKIKYFISNRHESIFGTNRIDSLRIITKTFYEYDDSGQLIKQKSNEYFSKDSVLYFYNDKKQLEYKIEHNSKQRSGCLIKDIENINRITYFYNKHGLVRKVKYEAFDKYPNGRIKRINKYSIRRRYKYYDPKTTKGITPPANSPPDSH